MFGPVLSILGYENVDEAVQIANDTEYGLAACALLFTFWRRTYSTLN